MARPRARRPAAAWETLAATALGASVHAGLADRSLGELTMPEHRVP